MHIIRRQFSVVVEKRSDSDALGINLGILPSGGLKVYDLNNEGLVFQWNEKNLNNPDLMVQVGDLIIAVNGTTGKADNMLKRLKENTLILMVERHENLANVLPKGTTIASQELAAGDCTASDTTAATQELALANVTPGDTTPTTQELAAANVAPSDAMTGAQNQVAEPTVEPLIRLAAANASEDQEEADHFPQETSLHVFKETTTPDVPFREETVVSHRGGACDRCLCSSSLVLPKADVYQWY